jgi:hypothetical protein
VRAAAALLSPFPPSPSSVKRSQIQAALLRYSYLSIYFSVAGFLFTTSRKCQLFILLDLELDLSLYFFSVFREGKKLFWDAKKKRSIFFVLSKNYQHYAELYEFLVCRS